MKKVIIFGFFYLLLTNVFSQKDNEAWKSEKNLESQYSSLKANASKWNGFIMIKEPQLNEFHKSIIDSVVTLEELIVTANSKAANAEKQQKTLSTELSETKEKLEASLLKEKEMVTLGMPVNKNVFPTVMYSIIIGVVLIALIAFFLFLRSNSVTKEIEKRYQKLSEELKDQKSKALDREAKLARELQTERNKNTASSK